LFLFIGPLLLCSAHVFSQSVKVLPLGNSLTKGVYCTNGTIGTCTTLPDNQMVGYRKQLHTLLAGAGYIPDFVGNEVAGWSVFDEYTHAGYPGITAAGLATKLNDNSNYLLNSTQPDIVLLEIGTNDIQAGITHVAEVGNILNEINEYESSSGKPVLVFISKVIRHRQGYGDATMLNNYNTFNSNLYNLYTTRKGAGDLIEWLDVGSTLNYQGEPAGDMKDELHPNQAGYDKMAQQWFNAIHAYNSAPVVASIPAQYTEEGNAFGTLALDGYVSDIETSDADIAWTLASTPVHLNVSVGSGRQLAVSPKDANWSGSENITMIATDKGKTLAGLRKSASVTIQFVVQPVNDVPVILLQKRIPAVNEENSLSLSLSDLEVEDIDNMPGELSLQVLAGASYSFSGLSVTPAADFNGELSVLVRVLDPLGASESFPFLINVTPVNDIPVIQTAANLVKNEDTSFELILGNYTVSDPDNFYPADFSLQISNGSHYTRNGSIITPEKDYNGEIEVPVTVSDGLDQSNQFLHEITISPVNDPPTLNIPSEREAYTGDYFELQITASDVDGDDLILAAPLKPLWLTFNNVSGLLNGTPGSQFVGENSVTVSVNDGSETIDSLLVLTVFPKSGLADMNENGIWAIISPVPATRFVTIRFASPQAGLAHFSLKDLAGQLISTCTISKIEQTDCYFEEGIAPGIYLYELTDGTHYQAGKILIR